MESREPRSGSRNTNRVIVDDNEGSSSSSSEDEGPELPKELKQVPSSYASSFQKKRKCNCTTKCWKDWLIIFLAFLAFYCFLGFFMWAMVEPMLYDTYTTLIIWGSIWVAFVMCILIAVIWRQHQLKLERFKLEEAERRAEEERLKPVQVKVDEDRE
ncbi:unnamed protein product [Blepharisma stoltei]|uniref:Transmembrane protein n=1 Tax=Blepharisma stoltei TaxID=1481888 RepID=A0AAU9IQE9_9CILI|nr:unnamed protein product [Blepharisma stoltei]